MSKSSSITISVPGTTANLGPGFDSFGLALDLANLVTITQKEPKIPLPAMVVVTAESFFAGSGLIPFPFDWKIKGTVPQARGLGSSVTVRLGVLMGLNELSGRPISRDGIFRLCAELEGHPDNAAAALYGGFTIARTFQMPLRYTVSSDLRFILLIPDFEVATPDARKVMPKSISVADAAANAADAAVVAVAFATKRYDLLCGAFADRLHQPYRTKLVPFLPDVIKAAELHGALGAWLSGSGSTICALSPDAKSTAHLAKAMKSKAPKGSRIVICSADNKGASVLNKSASVLK
jgi:homoserine kinase